MLWFNICVFCYGSIACYNIHWNYGLLPQTWENPSFANSKVEGEVGDNDPERKICEVLKVKPLGALAMIDEGELDSKIVAISLNDTKASLVNDVNDVEKHFTMTRRILWK
ncbi:soluble inorganic pyrophosphatase 6, chloroplastic-like isoform X2 [Vigna angularis]|uniref:soluble inorganic pyrophosphatase 6, chloroplastic-like isoform X2 n=1 Tax=Phaseolus angularis TaxID=3914 RepID=UPI0022B5E39A|nr:soluble inorganic pyrophosphatase 6, chloroplastic-like isoform X2 [Vigna angularis]